MNKLHRAPLLGATTFTLAMLLAACGGGGGGGGSTPPVTGGGGGATPTPPGSTPTPVSTPTPTSTATPTPGASGMLSINGAPLANATVVFTCGCNGNGGKITTDGGGNYTIGSSAPAVSGGGTYTPSGNNLMVVGYAANGTQAWTMQFYGSTPAHDLTLGSNTSDLASTAAALYVYYAASLVNSNDKTFDWFNFNTIKAFAQHLRAGSGLTAHESSFLSHITAEQAAGHTLYPGFAPTWDPNGSHSFNATLGSDVKAIATDGIGMDATLPTPCPGVNQCSGAPTP